MMSRKDYQLLATTLGMAGRGMSDNTWSATLQRFVLALEADNTRFVSSTFIDWAREVRNGMRDEQGTLFATAYEAYKAERERLGV